MKNRKRIFVIGPRGFPHVQGGIERFSENLYPLMVAEGYEVYSFAIKKYASHVEWKGVKFIYLPVLPGKSLERISYNFFASLHCIFRRPDLVHIHSIASGTFIFLLKLFRLKILARYNSRDYLHGKWNAFAKAILLFSERQFLLCDYIVANNKSYIEHLRSLGRKKGLSFLPNGISTEATEQPVRTAVMQELNLRPGGYILAVGRITEEKNFETLIRAFSLLDNPQGLKLLIVGDAAHKEAYAAEIKERYADVKNLVFAGKRERAALNALFADCFLFVQASAFEGMPNTVLEAMSFNCRMLLSDIPAHRGFELPETSYFPTFNEQELKQAIEAALLWPAPDYKPLLAAYTWESVLAEVCRIQEQEIT